MNMNNNFKLNEDYVVDIELLRFEKLVEEREAYEEQFLSMEPPKDMFDYQITEHEYGLEIQELLGLRDDFEEELSDPFELEDRQNQLRDKILIENRERYELNHSSVVIDEFALNDFYDCQIEAREEEELSERNGFDYDYGPEEYGDFIYDQYEEDMYYRLRYLRESQFEKPDCACAYMDYMPNDDGMCDYLDCYDYPDGPDENLGGVIYPF